MRIEYDKEADALYVSVCNGERARTVEVEPQNIYVDVDERNRTLGVEFLSFSAFARYIDEHDGLQLPEWFAGPQSLIPST